MIKPVFFWSNRNNIIEATHVDFVEDLPYFIAMLVALQRFRDDWGSVSISLVESYHIQFPLENSSAEFQGCKFKVVCPGEPLASHFGYLG